MKPETGPPQTLDRLGARLLHLLDPDSADRYDPEAFTRRPLSCVQDSTGMTVGRFQLDPAGGARFQAALDRVSRPQPAAASMTSDGQQVMIGDDRSADQRRADGLVALADAASRYADRHGIGSPGPSTQVLVVASPDQLTAARRAPDRTPASGPSR